MAYPAAKRGETHSWTNEYAYRTQLKDGTAVVLRRLRSVSDDAVIQSMHELLNFEIDCGNSYPIDAPLSRKEFASYFLAYECFVLVRETSISVQGACGSRLSEGFRLPNPDFVGCFYIKPNWPGRCSHVCNGGFLVAPAFRGLGAGFIMGEQYRLLAKRLGYRSSMFNLVFETNVASNMLWHKLGFTNCGRVEDAGRLKLSPSEELAALEQSIKRMRNKIQCASRAEGSRFDREVFKRMGGEAFVDALQWQLDLRPPLAHIAPTWTVSSSKL